MLHIYRKSEKSLYNLYGIEEISDLSSYDKPFLLCLSSDDTTNKSVFGIIKEGARAARVRTSDELAGGFKIDEIPFDFLGARDDENKKSDSLVNEFIYPFLKRGINIKTQARKINFFTYCNATNTYLEIENKLISKLKEDGYSEKDIDEILSQIAVVSIASEIDTSKVKATCMLFNDVNDTDVKNRRIRKSSEKMISLNRESILERISDNSMMLCYSGSGNHDLKEYFKDTSILKPSICSVISTLVERSIKSVRGEELFPINVSALGKRALNYDGEFVDNQILLEKLDSNIDYGFVKRYTIDENEILKNLDKVCKKLIATKVFLASQVYSQESTKHKL